MHATLVTGIKINTYELGEIPKFDDSANFKEAGELIKAVNDSGMFFKKVELGSSMTVKGYVTDTMIRSAKTYIMYYIFADRHFGQPLKII